jgi:hypothetical protein
MDRQNNKDTKQNTKSVNWWTDKTINIFGILFGIFIVLSVHQLTPLVFCLVSLLFCRFINWHFWYSVWYLYCFVGPSIDRFGILFGIFIALSIHQLTTLVSCLVSLLFCRSINWQLWDPVWYLHCFVDPSIDSFGILFGAMKIPNRIPNLSIDGPTKQ